MQKSDSAISRQLAAAIRNVVTPLQLARELHKHSKTIYKVLARLGIHKVTRDYVLTAEQADLVRQTVRQTIQDGPGRPPIYQGKKPWEKDGISRQTWYARRAKQHEAEGSAGSSAAPRRARRGSA